MKDKLLNKIQKLNTELDQLLSDLRNYSHEALNRQPTPGSWSATQILHHLLLAEKYSLQYCKKKLSFQPTLKTAGWPAQLKAGLVNWYLRLPLKFKAPVKISGPALPEESDLDAIAEEWRAQRKELQAFFEELPPEYIDKVVYKHPMGGRLSFMGMLNFFDGHFERHRKQLFKALESAEKKMEKVSEHH